MVIEGEMSRRDDVAIVRREGFTASSDAERSLAVILEIAQRVARAFYNAFGSERAADLDFFTQREGFRDRHRGDLERINRSHVQTAITADQTKPGQEQDAYHPCRITDVRFHDSLGLEVDAETCRDSRSEKIDVRAEEEQSAATDDKEQVIRQEQFYSEMQPAAPNYARTALCSIDVGLRLEDVGGFHKDFLKDERLD